MLSDWTTYLGLDKHSNIFAFLVGMTLTMSVIILLVWLSVLIEERKGTDWQKYSSRVMMSGFVMGVVLLVIYSFFVMIVLNYLYKPFPLDNVGMFIAGSITSVTVVFIWLSYNAILRTFNVSDDAWQTKLLLGSPFIVILVSFTILYYFFS